MLMARKLSDLSFFLMMDLISTQTEDVVQECELFCSPGLEPHVAVDQGCPDPVLAAVELCFLSYRAGTGFLQGMWYLGCLAGRTKNPAWTSRPGFVHPRCMLNLSVARSEYVGQLVNYPLLVLSWDLFKLKWTSVSTVTVTNACASLTMATFNDPHSSSKLPLSNPPLSLRVHPHLLLKLHSFSLFSATRLLSRTEKGGK